MRLPQSLLFVLAGSALTLAAQSVVNSPKYVSPNGATELKVLIDSSNLGGSEVDVGEMTFAPNLDSGEHVHGAVEIFYVLSGELEHVVNGKSTILKPGMTGFVRPPDKVRHKTGRAPTKALVIWAPGGEAGRIASRWRRVEGGAPGQLMVAPPPQVVTSARSAPATIIEKAKEDLAKRVSIPVTQINVIESSEVEWSDSSLGCPEPGMNYAQVITPGYRVILEAGGKRHEYHSNRDTRVVYCSR